MNRTHSEEIPMPRITVFRAARPDDEALKPTLIAPRRLPRRQMSDSHTLARAVFAVTNTEDELDAGL